jgi:hypothetical protein
MPGYIHQVGVACNDIAKGRDTVGLKPPRSEYSKPYLKRDQHQQTTSARTCNFRILEMQWCSGETLGWGTWRLRESYLSISPHNRELSLWKKNSDLPKDSKDDQAARCCFDDQTTSYLSLVSLRADGKERRISSGYDSPPCRYESARPSRIRQRVKRDVGPRQPKHLQI